VSTAHSTRRNRRSAVVAAALLAVAALTVAACGQESESGAAAGAPAPGAEAASAARTQGATVIDVRTPDEFAAGHVEGAELIDIQDAGFADRIAALDPATTYVVYCRSGNRSATAATEMRAAGLTVLDGGSLQDMTGAGWATT
jgi:rhodanese-related sulfurtransferase